MDTDLWLELFEEAACDEDSLYLDDADESCTL